MVKEYDEEFLVGNVWIDAEEYYFEEVWGGMATQHTPLGILRRLRSVVRQKPGRENMLGHLRCVQRVELSPYLRWVYTETHQEWHAILGEEWYLVNIILEYNWDPEDEMIW